MPEFTPRSMRARAHARKPLGALSPNVAAPTGGAQKPTGAQKPPRAVHPSVARVIGASSIGATPSREHTKPRIVGAAVPAAQEAPAPHVPAPRNFGARGARKARTSSQPPPPVPAARRASSLPPDYASEQPSIAGLAGTPIYDELAQQERTRRALSVALYAAQSEGRRLAALARSPRAEKPTRPPLDEDTDAPESPALADLLRVADDWAGAAAARRSTSVPPTPTPNAAPLTPVSELTPIRAAAVATPGTLHRLIARLDEPCPAALARKEAAKLREESCPSRLLVEIGHPSPAVHEMPDSPLDEAATETLLAELDAATSTSPHPLLVEPAPAKSWTRSVALPLFVLAAAVGHGVPALRGAAPSPVVVNATYGYVEPAIEPPSPDVVALRAFVDATPRRCAIAPARPSCRTDNLPDMPLGAWFRAAH